MKRLILIAAAVLITFCGVAEAKRTVTVNLGKGEGKVTELKGTAKYSAPGGDWAGLKTGQVLKGGYEVETGTATRLELTLPDASVLRFAEKTKFKVVSIDMDESAGTRNAKINVALGKTWANVNKGLNIKPNIDVSSANAVAGVRGTIYRMNVDEDQAVLVRVYDGEVNVMGGKGITTGSERKAPVLGQPHKIAGPTTVEGPHPVDMKTWVEIIRSMQEIRISSTGIPSKPRTFTWEEDRDDWVDYNRGRDQEIENPSSDVKGDVKGKSSWFDVFKR